MARESFSDAAFECSDIQRQNDKTTKFQDNQSSFMINHC